MIVCSQSCYLNIVTQMYPKDVLLNAAYYFADLTGPGNIPKSNPQQAENQMFLDEERFKYEDGVLTKTGAPVVNADVATQYHITWTQGSLNPTSLCTTMRMGKQDIGKTPEDRFIHCLKHTDAIKEIYEDLFYHKPQGNGLQILIYHTDKLCVRFGWIVCEYLSGLFGADVIYIDGGYRKKIPRRSRLKYEGNKEFATRQFIPWVRDMILIDKIKDCITHSGLHETICNVTNKINPMKWNELIHVYELLWPMDPLPRGKYSEEQLREIILHKILQGRPSSPYDHLDNLSAVNEFQLMASEYDLDGPG